MTSSAVEAVEPFRGNPHEPNARPFRGGCEILPAGVVPRLVEIDLQNTLRVGTQPREDRVKPEHHPRLALALHAGTKSILRDSRSTRTSFTFMRSARR